MEATEKRCTRCGETRQRSDFHGRARSHDGLQPHCKACAGAKGRRDRERYTEGNAAADIRAATVVKKCRVCKQERPSSEFRLARSKRDGLADECKPCFAEMSRDKHAARTSDERRARCLARFGLTPESYDEMLAAQGECCAICRTPEPGGRWNSHFHVDHDHATGRVRGLLCAHCNVMLGNASDEPARLRAAADYLEEATR